MYIIQKIVLAIDLPTVQLTIYIRLREQSHTPLGKNSHKTQRTILHMVRGRPIYVKINVATFSAVMKVEEAWHDRFVFLHGRVRAHKQRRKL